MCKVSKAFGKANAETESFCSSGGSTSLFFVKCPKAARVVNRLDLTRHTNLEATQARATLNRDITIYYQRLIIYDGQTKQT